MSKIRVTESELISYIKDSVKKHTNIIKEQEGKRTGISTSSSSSGAYISGAAWGRRWYTNRLR